MSEEDIIAGDAKRGIILVVSQHYLRIPPLTIVDSVTLTAIPEPSTYAAIFGGLALLGAFAYRRWVRK